MRLRGSSGQGTTTGETRLEAKVKILVVVRFVVLPVLVIIVVLLLPLYPLPLSPFLFIIRF